MKTSITILTLIFLHTLLVAQQKWDRINTSINEDLHDIEFINDSVGFIYSYGTGNIYRTSDEGVNWKIIKQTDSIYLEQIQFVNSNMGWICGEKGKILKTIDGGLTWSDISIISKDKNLLLYGMYFLDETTGYVAGAELYERKLHPITYFTKDGGATWTEVFEDIPKMILNIENHGENFFASGTGFIIKIDQQTKEWQYVFKDTAKIVGQIRGLKFADDKFGMATSFNGKILITNDRGNSFSYNEITKNRLRSLVYLGEQKWMAVGDNNNDGGAVLYFSSDNGESWEKNDSFPDIHRVSLTEKNIWIVGKEGLIAKMKR